MVQQQVADRVVVGREVRGTYMVTRVGVDTARRGGQPRQEVAGCGSAAAVGAAVLGEALGPLDWVAIALIVTANAVAGRQTSTTTDSPPVAALPERMVAASSTAPAHSQAVT